MAVPPILADDSKRRKNLADEHPSGLLRQHIEDELTSVKKLSKKLSLPVFPRYVAKIKKINWPTVLKVG